MRTKRRRTKRKVTRGKVTRRKVTRRKVTRRRRTKRKNTKRRRTRRSRKMKGGADEAPARTVYRFGLELEGCVDIAVEDPNIKQFQMNHPIYQTYPSYSLDCEELSDKFSEIETNHFVRVQEFLPCKMDAKMKAHLPEEWKSSPQLDYEKTQCSTELILNPDHRYYLSLDDGNVSYYKGDEDATREIDVDLTTILSALEPDLTELLHTGVPVNGPTLHFHISDEKQSGDTLREFISPESLKLCMIFCLLWYGCPGLYDHSLYDKYLSEFEVSEESFIPRAFSKVTSEFKSRPNIDKDEFIRVFTELTNDGGIEGCVRFLLKTMYPNNFKYMPIHIYNLSEVMSAVRQAWVMHKYLIEYEKGRLTANDIQLTQSDITGWDFYDKDIVEIIEGLLRGSGQINDRIREGLDVYTIVNSSSEIELHKLLGEYGSSPLRIEFRFAKLKSEGCAGFLREYSRLIMESFDYAKEVSQSWSPGEALNTPDEIFDFAKIPVLRDTTIENWLNNNKLSMFYPFFQDQGYDGNTDLLMAPYTDDDEVEGLIIGIKVWANREDSGIEHPKPHLRRLGRTIAALRIEDP